MNHRIRFTAGMFAACAMSAFARQSAAAQPLVQATGFVVDCASPRLPAQREVGEWTGLHNFGQVYAARERLMADIGRACRRRGAGRVQVTVHPPAQGEPGTGAVAQQPH